MNELTAKQKLIPYIFVISITIVSVLATFIGYLWISSSINSTPTKLADITSMQSMRYGFSEIIQEPGSLTSTISTTIKATYNTDRRDNPINAINQLTKTIDSVAGNNIVNIDLTIESRETTHQYIYYASTPNDYAVNGYFQKNIVNHIASTIENDEYSEYYFTYIPTQDNKSIKVEAYSYDNIGQNLKMFNQSVINETMNVFPLERGDHYEIVSGNKINNPDLLDNNTPAAIKNVINSDLSLEAALTQPDSIYEKIQALTNKQTTSRYYPSLDLNNVLYEIYPYPVTSQLTLTNNTSEEEVSSSKIIEELKTANTNNDKLWGPEEFTISVEDNEKTLATIHSYYDW